MVEKLFNITIKELNKHNIAGSCVLLRLLFNQCVPNSQSVKVFLIRGKYYCVHVWIKNNNKMYGIAYMQNMRNFDQNNLHSPQ